MAERIHLKKPIYIPEWKGVFENWTKAYVAKNAWRVRSHLGDFEDVMQACGEAFADCVRLYAGKVDNPRWFMSLYKQAVITRFIDWAKKDARLRSTQQEFAEEIKETHQDLEYGSAELSAALAEGSGELKQVLSMILNAPSELLGIMLQDASDAVRWSRRLCRMAKVYKVNENVVSELRSILTKEIE